MSLRERTRFGTYWCAQRGGRAAAAGIVLALWSLAPTATQPAVAQASGPTMVHKNLAVNTLVADLVTPIAVEFLSQNDFFVIEKNTGRVQRFVDQAFHSTVLDLAVNAANERGLLGIALHPDFPADPGVYLYWTCPSTAAQDADPFRPEEIRCSEEPDFGADSEDTSQVPLIANRIDRFEWDGSNLTFDHNLIMLRAFQHDGAPDPPDQGDEAQPARANHNAGVLVFGPDEKLYAIVGDLGRRGHLQNLPSGPTATGLGETVPDDQFGGPEADDAHLAGVILRLNADGTTPSDNPFFAAGASIGGEVGANIQRIFAYGIRNSFGMAFDPQSGNLWYQENGEDAYDELNLVEAGMNSGWIQFMGPAGRVADFKAIETTAVHHEDFPNLQQFRWGPERIADTPEEAMSRLFVLPGSHYSDPEFSWKHVLAPAAIGFIEGRALGPQFRGDLAVGFSVPEPLGGPLFLFNLTGNRRKIAVDDPRLKDRVADNATFHEMGESESLLIGTDFGVVTDIKTRPGGTLIVVSLSSGAIYEITRRR